MKNYKRKYFVYWHSQVSYLLKLGQSVTKSHLSRGFAGRQLQNSAHFFSFLLPQTSSSLGFSCLHFSLTSQLDGGRTDFSSSLLQHSTAPSLSVNLWALRSTTLSPNRHCFSRFLAVFWNLRILACFICESCSERNCSYVIMLAHGIRGGCWWYCWTFSPISRYILLPWDRRQQRNNLTEWYLTWKCLWSKKGANEFLHAKKKTAPFVKDQQKNTSCLSEMFLVYLKHLQCKAIIMTTSWRPLFVRYEIPCKQDSLTSLTTTTFPARKFLLQTYFWQTCYWEFTCLWPWDGALTNLADIKGCLRGVPHHLHHHWCWWVQDYDLLTCAFIPSSLLWHQ